MLLTWKSIDTFLECEINVHLCQNWRSLMERSGGWRVRERSRCNTQTREMGDLNDCGHSAGAGTGGQAVGWVDCGLKSTESHPEPRDAKSQEIDNIDIVLSVKCDCDCEPHRIPWFVIHGSNPTLNKVTLKYISHSIARCEAVKLSRVGAQKPLH